MAYPSLAVVRVSVAAGRAPCRSAMAGMTLLRSPPPPSGSSQPPRSAQVWRSCTSDSLHGVQRFEQVRRPGRSGPVLQLDALTDRPWSVAAPSVSPAVFAAAPITCGACGGNFTA